MRGKKVWTEADDARIRDLAQHGATPFRAAAALGRTVISVRERARKIGSPLKSISEVRKDLKRRAELPGGRT